MLQRRCARAPARQAGTRPSRDLSLDTRAWHWIIEAAGGERLGYLIAYDLVRAGMGAYVKRIVVDDKSRGTGRAALGRFCAHAFADLIAPFVWLSVYPENGRGRRCYESLGFAEIGVSERRRDELRAAVGFSARSLVLSLPRPTS